MSTFKLVAKGEVLAGHEVEAVKAKIAKLFKLEPDSKELAAIFSGRPIRIRGGLSREQAEKFQAALQAAGLRCEIVAEAPEAVATPAVTAPPPVQPAAVKPAEEVAVKPAPFTPPPSQGEKEYNPYQQPQAELDVDTEPGDFALMEPKQLSAGAGVEWFKEGFFYFKQRPWLWIGCVLLFWVIYIVVSMIPVVSFVVGFFTPVFLAGFVVIPYKQFQREEFALADIFAGFRENTGKLIGVGALYLLGTIICAAIGFAAMFALMGGMQGIGAMMQNGMPPNPLMLILVVLIVCALLIPLAMANWFAPALVMLNDLSPIQAMRLSLKGCLRNWLPFLVYGLVGLVLMIVAILPIGLGLLVLGPVGLASIFASYRQIYTNTEF